MSAVAAVLATTFLASSVEAIEMVGADRVYIQQAIVTELMDWLRAGQPGLDPLERVSSQERRILKLIADGKTNRAIAMEIGLSEYTVKNHLKNILSKLHLRSRRQAADYGLARGWVRPPEPDT